MKRWAKWPLRATLLLVPMFWFGWYLPWLGFDNPRPAGVPAPYDTPVYYAAGEAVREGRSPYIPTPPPGPHRIRGPLYLYPPPAAALFSIFPVKLWTLHEVICVLIVVAVFVIGAGLAVAGGWALPWAGLFWAGAYAFVPYVWGQLFHGNIETILGALTIVGILVGGAWAGALLLTCAIIKVTPIWALGVFFVRDPRSRMVALWTFAGSSVFSAVIYGPVDLVRESLFWASRVAPTLSQGHYFFPNASLSMLPVSLFVPLPPVGESLPLYARLWLTVCQFGAPALAAWYTRKAPVRLQAATVLSVAIAFAPIMRAAAFPVVALAALLWWGERKRSPGEEMPGVAPIALTIPLLLCAAWATLWAALIYFPPTWSLWGR